jgi:NAD(P) transhydrogenase subunit alpha
MKIAIVKERRAFERRVAASPDTVKQLKAQGLDIAVETGAGDGAFFVDSAYEAAGATIAADEAAALDGADIVLKVQRPLLGKGAQLNELKLMKKGAVLVGLLAPLENKDDVAAYAKAGVTAISMELVPRITRAQTMDVLSSQANLAGYKAAVDAAAEFGRAMPMMMTAAGTIKAARVLVMGAGVAGLQAIATARRLGGVVFATDVRAAAKEQVESLGANFLMVDAEAMKTAETAGGYAREMGEDFQRRQRELITDALKRIDIVICTALIPGRKAPILLTGEMLGVMAPGSVVADIAVESGGNVEGSKPEETVTTAGGVRIIGYANAPAHIPVDASLLYARNLSAFLALIVDKEKGLTIDTDDEIIKASLLTMDGAVVNPALAPPPAPPPPPAEPAAPAAS